MSGEVTTGKGESLTMAQWVKALPTSPDDLGSSPGIHLVEGGLLSSDLHTCMMTRMCPYICTNTYTVRKYVKRARVMAQQSEELADLQRNIVQFPASAWQPTTISNSSFRGSQTLFWFL